MQIRDALLWTSLQFASVLALELLGIAVLARILSPADMGLFAGAFALIRIAMLAGTFGLHTAIIRSDALTQELRGAIVAIALVTATLSAGVIGGALALAPGLLLPAQTAMLAALMLPAIVINALATTSNAELQRDMRFPAIFRSRLAATALYQVVAIALALTGAGPVALALAFVASTAVFALSCARATGWSFVTWPRLRGSRAILRFTSTVFAITALGQVTQALPALVLARLVDMATLGFFSRSADLVTRANRAITEVAGNVVAPHVYRQTRAGEDPAQGFMNALARMTVAIWPAALLMSALAGPIVRLLLGPQWDAAIPVLQWLSLGLVLAPLRFLAGTYAMALGFERRVLLRAAVFVVVTGAALYALAGLGLTAVVLGLLAVQAAELLSTLAILWRRAGLRTGPVLVEMARSLAVTLAAVLPAWAIGLALPEGTGSDLTRIALGLVVAAALWLAALALVRHPIQDELPVSVPKLLRGVRRRAGR